MKISRLSPFAVVLWLLAATSAQTAAPPSAPAPSMIDVQVTGAGTPAVVFIPGLATPGVVWDDTVAQFAGAHACHVVTLAGFGGLPPVKTAHFMDDAADAIIAYIRAQKLDHPVLVGHSLGGVLALQIALKAPELPGRLVIVDSLPFLAAMMGPGIDTAAEAQPIADSYGKTLAGQTPEQFAAGQKTFVGAMVTSPEKAAAIAALTGKSDPPTVGQAMAELITDDLRPRLGEIKRPVLVCGAFADKIAMGVPRAAVENAYRKQYANLPGVRFEWFEHARHFIMVDDPAGFDAALKKELAAH